MVNGCACRMMLDLMYYISDITLFLYQHAHARPHNVVHFVVTCFPGMHMYSTKW